MRIELPDQTIREVELMLAKRGEAADVPAFIDRTLQRALLFETVREVKRQNAGADPEKVDQLINEAVEAARSEQNKATPDADGA